MIKSSIKQKRSLGKTSPLSKRPKLDFTLTNSASLSGSNNIEKESSEKESDSGERLGDEKFGSGSGENDIVQNLSNSDWDDDFSGDMIEKVCLIADLSQAMVQSKEKEKIQNVNEKLLANSKSSLTIEQTEEVFEKLNLELEKLQEKLNTKEGEVHILRSQLKQNDDAKQAAALQNMKVIEEIQEKYNDKLNSVEKELKSTKSKLVFKDLEYKTLSERCRQLEYNITKSKLAESQSASRPFHNQFQVKHLALPTKETFGDRYFFLNDKPNVKNECPKFPNFTPVLHEGKSLARLLCPEFFQHLPEPSIVPLYSYYSDTESYKNKVDRPEKFKWSELPKQTTQIKDLYKDVGSLFVYESFTQKKVIQIIQTILNTCEAILYHQNQIFQFLDKLQLCNFEYEKADRCLLEKEETTQVITLKNLLNCKKLNEEECGIELRRSLGLIYSLVKVSKTAFDMVKTNMIFFKLFKSIVASIGQLRRPVRYTGVLVGISFIMQKLLEDRNLGKEFLTLITETVEEMIFARPKLDVLREIINVLAAGKHHVELLTALCKKESLDSCMLYMDCKLKQTMFFTKNACPLKLLCMQVMGLACLPCNRKIRWDVTDCVIKWLNSSLSTQHSKHLKWLPVNPGFMEEDKCLNVTECLLYLLVLCVNDYNLNFPPFGSFDDSYIIKKTEMKKRNYLISIIGRGAVLFKRILKADQRQLHENSYSLRFSVLLKALMPNKSNQYRQTHASLSSVEMEAMVWIADLLESDLRVQDCYLKQNVSSLLDTEIFNALKINDETRIF